MSDISQKFLALSASKKKTIHLAVCQYSLEEWEKYSHANAPLSYVDSIVGVRHNVDFDLLREAYDAVRLNKYNNEIATKFLEPICAMQDMDLEFPSLIEYAYYSIYNLYRKYSGNQEIDDWLIVNQSISSQPGSLESDLIEKVYSYWD